MNILVLSDEIDKMLYDYFTPSKLENVDLIISCGDLKAEYLTFIATLAHCPLIYVRGNHDGSYLSKEPEGCICIEDDLFEYKGIRIAGFGGSVLYNYGPWQYSQSQMKKRTRKLRLMWKMRKGVDILVTHAPAFGLGDMEDPVHTGFMAFRDFLDRYHPKYHIHGHVHMSYDYNAKRIMEYGDTIIINGFKSYRFTYE